MTDPFRVLGIDHTFALDPSALAARHKELSLEAHPDRSRSDKVARRSALSRAIDVNEAFRRLRDPVLRAEALLEVRGAKGLVDEKPRAEFLMTILELRETLREAGEKRDVPAIEGMLADVARERAVAETELGRLFLLERWTDEEASALGHHLAAVRYFRRFEEEAAAYLDAL